MLRNMISLRLVLLVALGLTLVSCGNPVDPKAEVTTLHRGLSIDPESVDPHKSRSVQAAEVLRDIGEGLLSYSASGELVGGVAKEWTVAEDGLTYTFLLRDDARWSNGDPVTAEDFAFSFRRLVDPDTAAFYAEMLGSIVNVRTIIAGEKAPQDLGVVAVDERTLVITLDQPTPYLLSLLTSPSTFPVHPDSIAQHGDAFTRPGNLLSNGAYKLDAWEPGSVLVLSRNEYYWNNDETAIDAVNHHVLTQEMTELNRYRAGEIHITGSVPPDSIQQIRAERPAELHIAPYLGVYYYGFNLTRPPFKDNPQLRAALSMAVDRDVLVEQITGTSRGVLPMRT
jgi:oligopeptide transport system substrate-binding protein